MRRRLGIDSSLEAFERLLRAGVALAWVRLSLDAAASDAEVLRVHRQRRQRDRRPCAFLDRELSISRRADGPHGQAAA